MSAPDGAPDPAGPRRSAMRTERNWMTTSLTVSPIRRAAARSAGAPGIGGPLDQLVPLRERPPRRQGGGIVADQMRLERIAAPGHGADPLGTQPDQIFARHRRDRHGQQAAGDRRSGRRNPVRPCRTTRWRSGPIAGCGIQPARRSRAAPTLPGTSPTVRTSSSNSRAAPVAPTGSSSAMDWSNRAPRQSPSREIARIMRCSSRRTESSACGLGRSFPAPRSGSRRLRPAVRRRRVPRNG